jgi:DNA-binding CsgD family transcriptional regulator
VIGPRHSALVGRATELATLDRAATSAREGHGGLVLVHGEAGIGKSRLCRDFTASVGDALHLRGQAFPGDDIVAHAILVDTLRAARRNSDSSLWAAARSRATILGAVVPELLQGDAATVRFDDEIRIFESVLDVVEEVSAGRLTVWWAEDIHWADQASWRFLHYCARRAPAMPLLILATYRDDESLPDDPAWIRLVVPGSREGTARISLQRLSAGDTERLVRDLRGTSIVDADVRAVVQRSGGTPLLIEELAATTVADGSSLESVPDVVRVTARERARKAGGEARGLLELAAVMGHDADLDLLVDLRPDQAMAVESLVEAGLFRSASSGTVEFRHPLLREAVYDAIPWERRRRLHAEAASALMDHASPQSVERVARHWELAGRPDEALASLLEVIDMARRQANLLRTTTLGLLAVTLINRHDRLQPRREEVVEPLLGELFETGRWKDLAPLLYGALDNAATGTPRRVRLAAMRGQMDFQLGIPISQVLTGIERELVHITDDATPEGALMLYNAALVLYAAGKMSVAGELAERSIRGAAACGQLDVELRARLHRLNAEVMVDRDRAWTERQMREVEERARQAGLHQREAAAALIVARLTCRLDDIDRAERLARATSAWLEVGARMVRAWFLAFRGQLVEATTIIDGLAADDYESQATFAIFTGRCLIALMAGDGTAARKHVAKLQSPAYIEAPQTAPDPAAMHGWLLWEQGDMTAAAASFARCLEYLVESRIEPGMSGPYFIAMHVDALLSVGANEQAESIYAHQAAIEDRVDADRYTRTSFAAAHMRLMPSQAHLAAAVTAGETHWPWMGALAASWGATLLGDVAAAQHALDVWARIGYRSGVADMEHFLATAEGKPVAGVGGSLTARERTVADLIAEGLTNAQIAERLGISAVTVAHHVSSVLDKLGVASRTQVAVLRARGTTTPRRP